MNSEKLNELERMNGKAWNLRSLSKFAELPRGTTPQPNSPRWTFPLFASTPSF